MKSNINLRPERYLKRKGYCWIRNDKAYIYYESYLLWSQMFYQRFIIN